MAKSAFEKWFGKNFLETDRHPYRYWCLKGYKAALRWAKRNPDKLRTELEKLKAESCDR